MIDQSNLTQLRTELEKMGKDLDFIKGVELEFNRAVEKKALLKKTAEEEYLAHLRTELSKIAGSLLSEERILEITESKESFAKAAMLEAAEVWGGMREELMKMGCDEDYIEGMVKEAAWSFGGLGRIASNFAPAARELGFVNAAKTLGKRVFNPANFIDEAKSLGGAIDASGKFLGIPGTEGSAATSISHGVLGDWNKAILAKNPTGNAAIEGALTQSTQRAKNILGDLHSPYYERQHAALVTAAEGGDEAAQKALKSFADKSNPKPYATRMGYSPDQVDAFAEMNSVASTKRNTALPSPDLVSNLQNKAQEVVHNKFQKGTYSHPLEGASQMAVTGKPADTGFVRVTPSRGLRRAGKFALGGGMIGSMFGPMGMAAGGLGGAALGGLTGTLGTGGALAAGALGSGYLGYKGLQATGLIGQNNQLDNTGLPQDRNRLVPTFNNKFAGGVGGALLAALVAQETGLGGPYSWLLPVLGGVAGYNYFPQMMNKWKDPYGTGANYLGPAATAHMQQTMGQ